MDRTYCIQFKQGVDSRKRVVTSKTLEKEHIGMITATSRKYRVAANRRCSAKVGFLKNFAKSTGRHLRQSLFLRNLHPRPCNVIKNYTPAQGFFVNFAKFLRNVFYGKLPVTTH